MCLLNIGFIRTENDQNPCSCKTEFVIRDLNQDWKGKLTGKQDFQFLHTHPGIY